MKKCPYCAEEIQDEAVVCKHCHVSFPSQERLAATKRACGCLLIGGLATIAIIAGILVVSSIITSSPKTPPEGLPPFEVVGHQGIAYMIVVSPDLAKSERALWQIAEYLLTVDKRGAVQAMFWTNTVDAADHLPMNDRQMGTQIAQVNINLTNGFRELRALNGHQFVTP